MKEDFLIRDCNKCQYIETTEEEQTKNKEPHICTKQNKKLYHRGFHPILPAFLNSCPLVSDREAYLSRRHSDSYRDMMEGTDDYSRM